MALQACRSRYEAQIRALLNKAEPLQAIQARIIAQARRPPNVAGQGYTVQG